MSGKQAIVLLLIGLAAGALMSVMAANVLRAQASYPQALMQVQQVQLGALRNAAKSQQCSGARAGEASLILDATARDIERAFYTNATVPADFRERAEHLRAAISEVRAARDCAQFAPSVARLAASCDACHQSYRQ